MKEIKLEQGTPEWLQWRKSKIGGSDAPAIMQISPWKSRIDLWKEKLGAKENNFSNSDTERGKILEPVARKYISGFMEIDFEPIVAEHSSLEWMGASLDGISKDRKVAIEIKCPRNVQRQVPVHYYPQLQHQMEVCELECIWFFSYVNDSVNQILFVGRDDEYIKKLTKAEKEFHDWVENFCFPPQPYNERNDEQWLHLVSKWKEANSHLKSCQDQEEDLRNRLIQLSGGSNSMGAGIKLSKEVRKGPIDYKSIPELDKVNLDKYRKNPIECWKIIKE